MDMVEVADLAEESFKIAFRTEDLKEMKTVGDVLEYVRARLPPHAD
jgi:acyl carrier protein